MSVYQDVKATIDSPGAKFILAELKRKHRKAYAQYRECGDLNQLYYLQALQKVIDTALPEILEDLLNRHLKEENKTKRDPEWWHFWTWFNGVGG